MNAGRRSLPHEIPAWVDPANEVWFVTMCCQERGVNRLTVPSVAATLLEAVRFRHQTGFWYAHLFMLMPDHCHALLRFPPERKVAQTIRDWKRWTARQTGVQWQTDFFEHRLRAEESFSEKYQYILANPVRAQLVERETDWPWVWRPKEE